MTDQNRKILEGVSKGVLIVSTTQGAKNGKFLVPFKIPMGQGYRITVTPLRVSQVIFMIKTSYKPLVL